MSTDSLDGLWERRQARNMPLKPFSYISKWLQGAYLLSVLVMVLGLAFLAFEGWQGACHQTPPDSLMLGGPSLHGVHLASTMVLVSFLFLLASHLYCHYRRNRMQISYALQEEINILSQYASMQARYTQWASVSRSGAEAETMRKALSCHLKVADPHRAIEQWHEWAQQTLCLERYLAKEEVHAISQAIDTLPAHETTMPRRARI